MNTVLIVEDSATEQFAFSRMLKRHEFIVLTATNGDEGLRLAERDQPALILMDLVMPGGMDGFQATRRLQSNPRTRHIPIVIVSTKADQVDRVWALRQGARAYLTKPIDENTLIKTIKSIYS